MMQKGDTIPWSLCLLVLLSDCKKGKSQTFSSNALFKTILHAQHSHMQPEHYCCRPSPISSIFLVRRRPWCPWKPWCRPNPGIHVNPCSANKRKKQPHQQKFAELVCPPCPQSSPNGPIFLGQPLHQSRTYRRLIEI